MACLTKGAVVAAAGLSVALLAGCGNSEKFNRAAYEVCLADAKKAGSNIASASFENAEATSSTGNDQFRVNILYELGERKETRYIAEMSRDGSFKVADT